MTLDFILADIAKSVSGLRAAGVVQAYLFGSALRQDIAWTDIDILVVCEMGEDADFVRATLADICGNFPIDLLIMTAEEEAEFDFIRSESCRWLASNTPMSN